MVLLCKGLWLHPALVPSTETLLGHSDMKPWQQYFPPPLPWTSCFSAGCSRSCRQCVPPGSCTGSGWPRASPLPYPRCPHTGWGSTLRAQAAIWGAAPLSQKQEDTKQLCEERGWSNVPLFPTKCSRTAPSTWTWHSNSLSAQGIGQSSPRHPRAQGSTALPRGNGEFSTGDGRSHPGKEPSMPDSFLAFLSRQGSVGHLLCIPAGPAERSMIPLNISKTGSRAGAEPHS